MKLKNKRANILTENLVFIVLNLVFISILILFLFLRMSDISVLEEKYAKQIAIAIDSSKPLMEIHVNMEEGIEKAKDKGYTEELVTFTGNIVTVKLSERTGYSYSFFNEVSPSMYQVNEEDYLLRVSKKTPSIL